MLTYANIEDTMTTVASQVTADTALAGAAPGRASTLDAPALDAPDSLGDPMLSLVNISKSFGSVSVLENVSFSVPRAATVALLGPSGCGKTTLLRIIAGLERPDTGEVWSGSRLLTGPSKFVDVRRRRVGMVFQDLALFPHMTVFKNIAYGLGGRSFGARKQRQRDTVAEAIALVGLEGLEHRRPHQLSGGQQQRVALARALVPKPEVLLFDEPFASLDTSLRVEVRSEVHELLHSLGTTAVFVTHDQEEAFVIGEEVVIMANKGIVQHDRPSVLYSKPVSRWVGLFVGRANMLPAKLHPGGSQAETVLGTIKLAEACPSSQADILIRPEHLAMVSSSSPAAAPAPGVGTVELVEYHGHDTMYAVRLADNSVVKTLLPGSSPHFDHGSTVELCYVGPPATAFAKDEDSVPDPAAASAPPPPPASN